MSSRVDPLDPAIAALRDGARGSGAAALVDLTPEEARERVSGGDAACAAGPPVDHVEDLLVPTATQASPIRVRRYEHGAPHATLVYAHGGGWVTGDLEYADELCRFLAARAGLRVLSVEYRRAPEHRCPAAVDDVDRCLAWAAEQHRDLPLFVGGDSAGGNLAAVVAQRRRDLVTGLVAVYPVLDHDTTRDSYREQQDGFPIGARDMAWFFDHYTDPDQRSDPRVSPLRGVRAGHPPTYLLTAGHDPLRDEGFAYADALRALGVPLRHDHEPALCHGFLRTTGPSDGARAARDRLVEAVAGFVRDQTSVQQ
ncbi:alpha/beta hydrolase [Aeromicrobium camelliae]|uniref:Alpha/beta hydrolase n=1 Tax=Aeromicrobium camelliae TaxID=1538144 RepID=A0A3N6ZPD2_9ACTN|nr:alpha/beta hydrolase [Aeromicrobium camelliae]RQN08917.1 alpha/beta hydrolase [Aeromicrobium camelliae]